jgi:hypothetical protein
MTHTTVTAIRSPSNTNLPDHVVAFEVSKHQLVVHTLPADRQVVSPTRQWLCVAFCRPR